MMSCRSRLIAASGVFALMLSATSSQPVHGQYSPEVGAPHPDFVLPRIDNREAVSLAQFRGRKVLLIHFASW